MDDTKPPFDDSLLKLDKQICFPLYATSRLITQLYQPYLDQIGLTYPQYLVMMVLWETDDVPIKFLTEKLLLNTNTLTPLLKRMEANELIIREKCTIDERKVKIKLTSKGRNLKFKAIEIPISLKENLKNNQVTLTDLENLKNTLTNLINHIQNK